LRSVVSHPSAAIIGSIRSALVFASFAAPLALSGGRALKELREHVDERHGRCILLRVP
jgi:hypothetical protein